MKSSFKLLMLIVVLTLGCSEPIDLKVGLTEPKVVVDGYLSDQFKAQKIELNFSSTFYETGNNIFIPLPIRFANVLVIDDLGNEFPFAHTEDGVYLSQPFQAEFGRAYQLTIDVDGVKYESSYETMPKNTNQNAPVNIEYVSRASVNDKGESIQEMGVQSYAIMQKTLEEDFYIWSVNHHFIVETAAGTCYSKEFDLNQVIIVKDTESSNSGLVPYRVDLSFNVPSFKTNVDYAVDAALLTVSEASYTYWQKIKDQIDKTGGLFDANSNTIRGNIINTTTSKEALGFFGVYREVNNYFFYNQTDLPIEQNIYPCPGLCINCESIHAETSTEVKPDWWR